MTGRTAGVKTTAIAGCEEGAGRTARLSQLKRLPVN
jgi:hypothetical protein